ncbi:4-hydroxy-2-oxoglutarate aldolase, mitochondrial-like isoform X2 [Ischnura elegans]|nr:4-hydroxy-2-oxoglutarate aldolase, mitochondrial-like isoform X2 [Ischnura elegans]
MLRAAKGRLNLSGIFPPIPTPFRSDECIAYEKLASNIEKWKTIPFAGFVVQGSNGEYPLLEPQERVDLVLKVREYLGCDRLIIAGSSCESTRATVKMTQKMAEAGADAALVLAPHYYKSNMTVPTMEKFFKTVADQSPVPVILYNMPANTGIDMGPDIVTSLAHHPNIIGLKDSGGDITKMARIVKKTEELDFQVLAGSAGFLLPSLLVGCVGGILGLANILGREVCQMLQCYHQGAVEEALVLHKKFLEPNAVVTRELGVPAMKKACEFAGLYGGPCRTPLLPLSEEQVNRVKNAFQKSCYFLEQ